MSPRETSIPIDLDDQDAGSPGVCRSIRPGHVVGAALDDAFPPNVSGRAGTSMQPSGHSYAGWTRDRSIHGDRRPGRPVSSRQHACY